MGVVTSPWRHPGPLLIDPLPFGCLSPHLGASLHSWGFKRDPRGVKAPSGWNQRRKTITKCPDPATALHCAVGWCGPPSPICFGWSGLGHVNQLSGYLEQTRVFQASGSMLHLNTTSMAHTCQAIRGWRDPKVVHLPLWCQREGVGRILPSMMNPNKVTHCFTFPFALGGRGEGSPLPSQVPPPLLQQRGCVLLLGGGRAHRGGSWGVVLAGYCPCRQRSFWHSALHHPPINLCWLGNGEEGRGRGLPNPLSHQLPPFSLPGLVNTLV